MDTRYHVVLRYMVGSRAERTLRMDRMENHYFPSPQLVRAFLYVCSLECANGYILSLE